jgi:hypothetical protein
MLPESLRVEGVFIHSNSREKACPFRLRHIDDRVTVASFAAVIVAAYRLPVYLFSFHFTPAILAL